MGAWGYGNFENDDALDWVIEFEDKGVAAITEAFRAATEGDEIEAPEACTALAAAEVLAAAGGKPSPALPEALGAAIEKHRTNLADITALKAEARTIIDKVAKESELKELWDEAEELETWQPVVSELAGRLG